MPLASIIVPNFNHGRFLRQRLASILNQSVQDFELIFLDDASTDNSLEVFQQFSGDPRVSSHVNAENSGNPFVQWNKGFDLASGRYIWIAESDDFADPAFLEKMISCLDENPTAGMATCRSMIVDKDDSDVGLFDAYHWFNDRNRWKKGYFNSGHSEIGNYLLFQNTIPNASAVLFKRELIERGVRAPENMVVAGDLYFWVTLLLRCDICHTGDPLNYFRRAHHSSQRIRTALAGQEVIEGLLVYGLIDQNIQMTDKTRLLAQSGLVRRWYSIASQHGISFAGTKQVYRAFLRTRFSSGLTKVLQMCFVSIAALLLPLTRVPGFRSFSLWVRDLVTRAGHEKRSEA